MDFGHLNQPDLGPESGTEARRRVLARLGDDVALIMRQLQFRPVSATRVDHGGRYVLVRVTSPGEHVLVRIAPDDDLAAELHFSRALTERNIPTARVIAADLSRAQFPFPYLVETYIGGPRAEALTEPYQLRAAGRQLGRAARRLHQIGTPGWGRPTGSRAWTATAWDEVVQALLAESALEPAGRLVFGEAVQARILARLRQIEAPPQPQLVHGDMGPHCVIVTPGEQTQLVALVEPGTLIGGDPLFDVACVLSPEQPEPFRAGFLAGYYTGTPPEAEQQRLRQLRLLESYLSACRRYLHALPHEPSAFLAQALLQELVG
jgi:aminoglycoside phosphotransferase (APT) family kinase protein